MIIQDKILISHDNMNEWSMIIQDNWQDKILISPEADPAVLLAWVEKNAKKGQK